MPHKKRIAVLITNDMHKRLLVDARASNRSLGTQAAVVLAESLGLSAPDNSRGFAAMSAEQIKKIRSKVKNPGRKPL